MLSSLSHSYFVTVITTTSTVFSSSSLFYCVYNESFKLLGNGNGKSDEAEESNNF